MVKDLLRRFAFKEGGILLNRQRHIPNGAKPTRAAKLTTQKRISVSDVVLLTRFELVLNAF